MSKAGYTATTGAQVALAAGVAKTVLGIRAPAQFGLELKSFWVDFDGVTSTATPCRVDIGYATFATNAPGTASTSVTPFQCYGRAITVGATAAKDWSTEPTVITVIDDFSLDPNKGVFRWDWPLGETYDTDVSNGFVIRLAAAAIVNCRAGMRFERI
jgi:hypothetical protein